MAGSKELADSVDRASSGGLLELLVEDKDEILKEIIESEEIRAFERDGKLSESKRGLVSTVVALMLERLLAEREQRVKQAEREANRMWVVLGSGIRSFWNKSIVKESGDGAAEPPNSGFGALVSKWLTWGNLLSGCGALAVLIFAIYSGSYANYKKEAEDNIAMVKRLQEDKKELTNQKTELANENTRLTADLASANSAAETYKGMLESSSATLADTSTEVGGLQLQVKQLTANVTEQTQKYEKVQGQLNAQLGINRNTQKNLGDEQSRANRLDAELRNTRLELSRMKSKCGEDCEG